MSHEKPDFYSFTLDFYTILVQISVKSAKPLYSTGFQRGENDFYT